LLFAAGKHESNGSEPIAAVHRKYAQALFDAAKEKGRLSQVSEEFTDFAGAVHDIPELRSTLRNPRLEPRAKVGLLDELLGGADELIRNFLRLTAEKGRIGQIEDIAREFDRLMAREERRLNVELTTARALSEDEVRELLQQIAAASGRKVEASRKVDPNLIGGFVLQAGSLRVDASVRGRLESLRRELVRGR
jgi:F-type H+-transporting ATPase subunit delta